MKKTKQNKKAQFFLIAALVIIIIIISLAVTTNYFKKSQQEPKVYDLGDELNIESVQVLQYGTYNEYNQSKMQDLMINFTQTYTNAELDQKSLYFVFGNSNNVVVAGYSEVIAGDVSVNVGSGNSALTIRRNHYNSQNVNPNTESGKKIVTVNIPQPDGTVIPYKFELKDGENFYFVISQNLNGETSVVTN